MTAAVRAFGDAALLVDVDDAASARALREALLAVELPGVVDLVPGRRSLLVELDPAAAELEVVERAVRSASRSPVPRSEGRTRTIPVVYGGAWGPDLDAVAASVGLAPHDVVAAHAAASHRVAFCGFAPGFAYLDGLPAGWSIRRLASPRTRTPAGSVGVADGMTGIYPAELPGGWPIIGRTPRTLFDARRARPSYLEPGDRVRFEPIQADAWDRYARAADET